MPLLVSLCQGGAVIATYGPDTDRSGSFSADVVPGTFDVLVKNTHTLAVKANSITIPSGGSTSEIGFGTLPEGDANDDNMVTSLDFFVMKAHYNQVGQDCTTKADEQSIPWIPLRILTRAG
jgi:hypothetical protein